jgi:hypothetical protein
MGFFIVLALFALMVVFSPRGVKPGKAVPDNVSLSNRLDDSHNAHLGSDLSEMDSMLSSDLYSD